MSGLHNDINSSNINISKLSDGASGLYGLIGSSAVSKHSISSSSNGFLNPKAFLDHKHHILLSAELT